MAVLLGVCGAQMSGLGIAPAFAAAPVATQAMPASVSPASLREAAGAGDVERIRRLVEAGVDPNAVGDDGVAALHVAASEGRVDAVKELLRLGADVDLPEFDGDTALINASVFGRAEVVRLLLEAGADDAVKSSRGYSPIQHARREGHREVLAVLSAWKRDARKREAAAAARASAGGGGAALPESNAPGSAGGRSLDARAKRSYRPGYARRVAAVIGVNAYRDWPVLSGARADAEKVAARLKALGFDEVFELYDANATRSAILDLLGSKLSRVLGEDDLVVIFFAGHGQTETLGSGRKRGYIIPVDATLENVFSTAIPMRQLRELTNRLPAKHVYYAMDSCYSGLGFTRGLSIVKPSEDDYISKVTSLRSVQMVTAGGEGEEAIEKNGEGVFTRSFLDALRGEADANGDGYVTATEIGAYVAPRVTNETDARQSPQAGRLEGEGEVAFELKRR